MEQEGYTHLVGNTGYLLLKVPQDILNEIKISVDDIQKDFTQAISVNDKLAGHIDKEFRINLNHKATQYIKWTVGEYNKLDPSYLIDIGKLFGGEPILRYNRETWVNFQGKYEYNPMHTHNGVFSFVIWYQIPFYKENEVKHGPGKGNGGGNLNGEFEFIFYDGEVIRNKPLGIDKTMEGYMAIFPSSLYHAVYPFYTSDDYRITISGNIFLQGQ